MADKLGSPQLYRKIKKNRRITPSGLHFLNISTKKQCVDQNVTGSILQKTYFTDMEEPLPGHQELNGTG